MIAVVGVACRMLLQLPFLVLMSLDDGFGEVARTCEHFESSCQSVACVPQVGGVGAERVPDDLSQDWQHQVRSRLQVWVLSAHNLLHSRQGETTSAGNKTSYQ